MSRYYILDGHKPVACDMLTWVRWFESADRHVKLTEQGDVRISTVCLGLDHSFSDEGPPVLFETMAFGVEGLDDDQERYCTWDEAEAGHERWVNKIFKATPILALPQSEKA
jgi:hypothetical protein